VKEKFVKGSVIAKIPSCERKVRERLRDSRNSILLKEKFEKGSVIAEIPSCERRVREKAP
jgi:hypothetical protein